MTSRKNKVGISQVRGIDYDGMNQQEVADNLGISRTAVQQIERRAYKKFRRELAKRLKHITDLLWHRKINREKNVSNENEKNKTTELNREQIILWAYEAGFPTNYARNEITRFETFARLVQKYLERDYKWVSRQCRLIRSARR